MNFIRHSSDHFKFERFQKGSIIFHINDQADKFYLILKGKIGVFVPQDYDEIKSFREFSRQQLKAIASSNNDSIDEIKSFKEFPKSGMLQGNKANNNINSIPIITPFLSPSQSPLKTFFSANPTNTDSNYEAFFLQTTELKRRYFEDDLFIFKMIKVLGEKDCFGELALSNNKPRSATILALEDLCVLTLSKQDFERDFAEIIKKSHEKFAFFQKLFAMNQEESSSSALMRIIYYFNELKLPPNYSIFHQGEKASCFYVIVRGEVEITKYFEENKKKKGESEIRLGVKKNRQVMNIAKLGSFNLLGEEDVFEERENRSCSAMTVTQAKVYVISRKVDLFLRNVYIFQ